ncbi:NADH dehydrogenase subunit F [Perkinsela sp. CCAP 1560/4]|nr:NADH dehydrogenase subunit F [Perkinsela sp. CCAP 1560/4]|eukprot:KNH05465.1 NADH dehydrogenase subunit F [Perkinsela sp. CCAP 1560/4]
MLTILTCFVFKGKSEDSAYSQQVSIEETVFLSDSDKSDCFIEVYSSDASGGEIYKGFLFPSQYINIKTSEGRTETRYACIMKHAGNDDIPLVSLTWSDYLRVFLGLLVERKTPVRELFRCRVPAFPSMNVEELESAVEYISKTNETFTLSLFNRTVAEKMRSNDRPEEQNATDFKRFLPISFDYVKKTDFMTYVIGFFGNDEVKDSKQLLVTGSLLRKIAQLLHERKVTSCMTHRKSILGAQIMNSLCEKRELSYSPLYRLSEIQADLDGNVLLRQTSSPVVPHVRFDQDGVLYSLHPYAILHNIYDKSMRIRKLNYPSEPDIMKLMHYSVGPAEPYGNIRSEGWCAPNLLLDFFQKNTTVADKNMHIETDQRLLYALLSLRCHCLINQRLLAGYVDPAVLRAFEIPSRHSLRRRFSSIVASFEPQQRYEWFLCLLKPFKIGVLSLALVYFFCFHPLLSIFLLSVALSVLYLHIRDALRYLL